MSRSGIVNMKMVITEEKIISNIDKVQKLINPNNKKQIIQLEEDTYFKDLIESIKSYLISGLYLNISLLITLILSTLFNS